METQGWTQVNNTRKHGMEIDKDLWKSKTTQGKCNNGKDNVQANTAQTEIIKSKKRFHPTMFHTPKLSGGQEETGYLTTEQQIKLRRTVAIDTVTE
eukprot:11267702-Ditylum_brightwellii.AAC.1